MANHTEAEPPLAKKSYPHTVSQEKLPPLVLHEEALTSVVPEEPEDSATKTTPLTLGKGDVQSLAGHPIPQNELLSPKENLPLALKPQNLPKLDVPPHPTHSTPRRKKHTSNPSRGTKGLHVFYGGCEG